jgi:hypothetical protein
MEAREKKLNNAIDTKETIYIEKELENLKYNKNMSYEIEIRRHAEKDLASIPK